MTTENSLMASLPLHPCTQNNGVGVLCVAYDTNGSFYFCFTSAVRDACTGNSQQQVVSFFIP